jgi:hypothetical protein
VQPLDLNRAAIRFLNRPHARLTAHGVRPSIVAYVDPRARYEYVALSRRGSMPRVDKEE